MVWFLSHSRSSVAISLRHRTGSFVAGSRDSVSPEDHHSEANTATERPLNDRQRVLEASAFFRSSWNA
jgi:hypothetical protein